MGLTTLQGLPVLELQLTRPMVGNFVVTAEADYQSSDEDFKGLLELKDEAVTYNVTAVHSGVISGVARVELVGGNGGLLQDVPPRHFREATVKTVIESLLELAGEQLDDTSTATMMARKLPFWSWGGDPFNNRAGVHLTGITDKLGANWRMLPNGKVWVGTEAWTPASEELVALELDRNDADGHVLVATETLELGPGVTLAGRRVGRVEHSFDRKDSLRTTFWVEP